MIDDVDPEAHCEVVENMPVNFHAVRLFRTLKASPHGAAAQKAELSCRSYHINWGPCGGTT